ncbi:MAG: hypothetical protein IPK04_10705 [Bdellovibrionales bacterium]|nr:hypothetical protein [Bdellovibrionales bacterium]
MSSMHVFLLSVLVLWIFSITGSLQTLSLPSSPFHHICVLRIQTVVKYSHFLDSLVCGTPFNDLKLKSLFINSSLVHLVVVSGSHFLVLLILLKFCTTQPWVQLSVIISYWLITQTQPPGMLAILFWSLRQKTSAELRPDQMVLLCGLGCFLVNPRLWHSPSLYLSWLCSLGLSLAQVTSVSNILRPQLIIYTLINLIGGWDQWSHPLGILINATIGTLLSLFLFPLGAFVVVTQQGGFIFDRMTSSLIWILKSFGPPPLDDRHWIWNEWWWLWIASLHILIWRWQDRSLKHALNKRHLTPLPSREKDS